jgi:TolB-like protein
LLYLFEDCALDTDRRELRRGVRLVPVEPQVFDLLQYLIWNRERVVSKDDLIASIWGGRIVSESALATRINAARSAIGDSGEAQRLIKTLPRKGIRFVGAVREERRSAEAIAVTNAEPAGDPRQRMAAIAVLPFDNMSGDPEQDYFAHGMAEEIITALSRFRSLQVMSRNSSFPYKGRNVDARTVGRELRVRYVLEGSVRKAGNHLRITVELLEAMTANDLWAEKYDGALADVFDLQDKITEDVVGTIEPSVRKAEIERAQRKRPENLDAYDLYLRALPHVWAHTPDDSNKAIEFLEDALRIDPSYVAAHGYSTSCYIQQLNWGGPNEAGRKIAIVHANAVRESNTDDAVALSCAGFAFAMLGNDFELARNVLDQAVTFNPNAAEVFGRSAIVHALMGHIEQTIQHAERALQISPFDPLRRFALYAVSLANFVSGHYDQSAAWAQRAIQVNPHFLVSHALLTASYVRLGRVVDAKEAAWRAKSIYPSINWSTLATAAVPPMHRQNMISALREAGLLE